MYKYRSCRPVGVRSEPSPDGTGDYEINTTLALKASGGTYIHYLHASPDALSANSGSYDSVEVSYPNFVYNGCVATVSYYERVNGLITLLSQTQILCRDGMQMRTVSNGNMVSLLYNNELLGVNVGLSGGQPGIGGHDMPAGNAMSPVQLGLRDKIAPAAVDA